MVVPEWALPIEADDYEYFLQLVTKRFLGKAVIENGVVSLSQKNGEPVSFGLSNVLGLCRQEDKEDWPTIIEEHFANCERSLAESSQENFKDFSTIKDQLALRVMPAATLDKGHQNEWLYRPGPDGTVTVLVVDQPSAIVTVKKDTALGWDIKKKELFELALKNVLHRFPVEMERQNLPNGYELTVLHGSHFYVTTHILLLDEYEDLIGPYGSLVGIPVRDLAIIFPIRCFNGTIQAVNAIPPILASMWKDGPGSTSAELYWYNAGIFTPIPYKIKGQELDILVPASFKSLLELLAAL